MRLGLLALVWALAPMTLAAQTIYKCTEAGGGTLISNTRVDKSCKVIVSESDNAVPAPPRAAAVATAPSARVVGSSSPANFPRVQESAQKARDGDRRHILEQELAGEQRHLDQAKKDLAEQENIRGTAGAPERLAPYRDRVAQHERNIQAIQKELGGLR